MPRGNKSVNTIELLYLVTKMGEVEAQTLLFIFINRIRREEAVRTSTG